MKDYDIAAWILQNVIDWLLIYTERGGGILDWLLIVIYTKKGGILMIANHVDINNIIVYILIKAFSIHFIYKLPLQSIIYMPHLRYLTSIGILFTP